MHLMPQAMHTVLEVVYFRWGVAARLNLLFFSRMACLIVTAMLILKALQRSTRSSVSLLLQLFPGSLLAALALR
jgi:hypothetical protein